MVIVVSDGLDAVGDPTPATLFSKGVIRLSPDDIQDLPKVA